jgi:hypothetical protein
MKGRVIDIGTVDRQDVVAPTHLLLDTLLVTNPGAMVEVELLATVETVAENLKYSGTPSKLLGEFPQTSILGFIIMVGRGTKGGGHIFGSTTQLLRFKISLLVHRGRQSRRME